MAQNTCHKYKYFCWSVPDIFTVRQWSYRKVIFSVVSVLQLFILSTGRVPYDHYLWCIRSYCTAPWPIPTSASDLGPPALAPHQALAPFTLALRFPGPNYSPMLVTSGGDHWIPVQTCPFRDTQEWHLVVASKLKHVRFPSGRYSPYWNVFLCHIDLLINYMIMLWPSAWTVCLAFIVRHELLSKTDIWCYIN